MPENNIDENTFVTDIVAHDYRAADIFRKYDIDFCCGGKWPLDMVCKNKGLDTDEPSFSPLTPALSPLRGEGARTAASTSALSTAALVAPSWSGEPEPP